MSRRVMLILGLLVVLGQTRATAQVVPLGEFCFELSPFGDVVHLQTVHAPAPGLLVASYAVEWIGGTSYVLTGGGSATGANVFGVTFVASHGTEFFGGNPVCELNATWDLTEQKGPWMFHCDGPNAPFLNAGELTPVDCSISVIPTHGLPLAGE